MEKVNTASVKPNKSENRMLINYNEMGVKKKEINNLLYA